MQRSISCAKKNHFHWRKKQLIELLQEQSVEHLQAAIDKTLQEQLIELLQEQSVEHIQAAIIGSKTFLHFVWCCQGFDVIANFT